MTPLNDSWGCPITEKCISKGIHATGLYDTPKRPQFNTD